MADLDRTRLEPIEQFFDELARIHDAFLTVRSDPSGLQPMAPMADRDRRRINFFTKADTDLARNVGTGAAAMLVVTGRDHDYHACLTGRLSPAADARAIVDRHWTPMVSAWFEGKDDPSLLVLAFAPEEASVWASTDSRLRYGWEILRANMDKDREPHVGVRTTIRF